MIDRKVAASQSRGRVSKGPEHIGGAAFQRMVTVRRRPVVEQEFANIDGNAFVRLKTVPR